jgi:hypothetical protein
MGKALCALVVVVGLAACNPLTTDPVTIGGELDVTAARYTGPDATWLAVAVVGAPEHAVYVFALIRDEDRVGPEQRSCHLSTVVPCDVTPSDIRMPNQRLVAGDGSQRVRLITVWSGETVQVVLVCVDPDTQELGCPPALRTRLSAIDGAGNRVGALAPATPGP